MNIKKPIIWVHIPYDINARKWESFFSRNTENLNQDYLYLTLRTIIEKNSNDFHICLINENGHAYPRFWRYEFKKYFSSCNYENLNDNRTLFILKK